jgi:hypothetical protein
MDPATNKVRVTLPTGHEAGFRQSIAGMSEFHIEDVSDGVVAIEPREGPGVVRRYFEPFRLCTAATDLDDAGIWQPIFRHPPYSPKPEVTLPADVQASMLSLDQSDELPAVMMRLGARVAMAEPQDLPDVLRTELPELFRRYPGGSLWYIAVDHALVSRLAFARVSLQLELTPDVDFDPDARDGVTYFGMHSITGGINFGKVLDTVLLAIPPVVSGVSKSTFPHPMVFLFGQFEDLRTHGPGPLARAFFPDVSRNRRRPASRFPSRTSRRRTSKRCCSGGPRGWTSSTAMPRTRRAFTATENTMPLHRRAGSSHSNG